MIIHRVYPPVDCRNPFGQDDSVVNRRDYLRNKGTTENTEFLMKTCCVWSQLPRTMTTPFFRKSKKRHHTLHKVWCPCSFYKKRENPFYGVTDSPPLTEPKAPQTPNCEYPPLTHFNGADKPFVAALIVSETKKILPSPRAMLTPPVCLLEADISLAGPAAKGAAVAESSNPVAELQLGLFGGRMNETAV